MKKMAILVMLLCNLCYGAYTIPAGSTDVSLLFPVRGVTDSKLDTGLTTTSFHYGWKRAGAAASVIVTCIDGTEGTYAVKSIKESATLKGCYELDVNDAAFAAGVSYVDVYLYYGADTTETAEFTEILTVNLTPILDVNVAQWAGTAVAVPNTAGIPLVDVNLVSNDELLSDPHIWYVTTTGAGDASGHTWNTAMATIGVAVTAAADGDTIYIAAGTYDENVELTGKDDVTLIGSGSKTCIIAPTTGNGILFENGTILKNLTVQPVHADGKALLCSGSKTRIEIENCDLIGGNTKAVDLGTINYAILKNTYVFGTGTAIYINGVSNLEAENCWFKTDCTYNSGGAKYYACYDLGPNHRRVFRNCNFYAARNDATAFDTVAYSTEYSASLIDCHVRAFGSNAGYTGNVYGIWLYDPYSTSWHARVTVRDSIFMTSNSGSGTATDVHAPTGHNIQLDNCIYSTTSGIVIDVSADWADGGRLDSILDSVLTDTNDIQEDWATVVSNIAAVLVDTNDIETNHEPTDIVSALMSDTGITAGGTYTIEDFIKCLGAYTFGNWLDKTGSGTATQQILDWEDDSTVIMEITASSSTPYKQTTKN